MTRIGPTTAGADGSRRGAVSAAKPVWYRRRAVLVGGAVAAILAFTVISDLPQHTAIAQQVSEETTVIGEIHADASSCLYAVQEAFKFYGEERQGALSSAQRAVVPGLLADDQNACSFLSTSIFDLSNIEVPGTAAGREIGDVVSTVTLWATSDALAAVEAIQRLWANDTDPSALASLAKAEHQLASDRAAVISELTAADHVLDNAHLPGPGLPILPDPASPAST